MKKKVVRTQESFSRLDAVLVILAALLVAAGIYYYFIWKNGGPAASVPQVTAVNGSLASGFPQDFIQNSFVIQQSSLQKYSNGAKLWSASFTSPLSPKEILSGYANLFGFLHWSITQSSGSMISAQNGNTQVSVLAQETGFGAQVSVSILQK
jgi:hypothetical protein